MDSKESVRARELGKKLTIGPMRRGSVVERRMRCGQPGCACHSDPEAMHGPYVSLTKTVGGKTRTRYVDPAVIDVVRRQQETMRAFRAAVNDLMNACEEWADEDLAEAEGEDAKKNDNSRRRSRLRQKRS